MGSCIPNNTTYYGVLGSAFYINAESATPAFTDLNAAIHATSDISTKSVSYFTMGTASSIDDKGEVTLIGQSINKKGVEKEGPSSPQRLRTTSKFGLLRCGMAYAAKAALLSR